MGWAKARDYNARGHTVSLPVTDRSAVLRSILTALPVTLELVASIPSQTLGVALELPRYGAIKPDNL